LAWGDEHRPRRPVRNAEHLDELLDEPATESSVSKSMIELRSPAAASCVIGIDRPRSVVTFNESLAVPPYFRSRGPPTAGDALVFFFNGHWTELDSEAAVPAEDAVRALRQFYDTGGAADRRRLARSVSARRGSVHEMTPVAEGLRQRGSTGFNGGQIFELSRAGASGSRPDSAHAQRADRRRLSVGGGEELREGTRPERP
jgi:immunity protein Imm1 of predicted polymorphic toxin system